MRLDNLAIGTIEHLAGRLVRRLLIILLTLVLALVAVVYFVSAGEIELTARFGSLNAQLILGAIFMAAALLMFTVWWVMRARPAVKTAPALVSQREMQLAMLVEAVLLGYALARKSERSR